ncbi:MAG: hypothetical protein V2I54_12860 [Bacteroidales bacterium]|jgi:hypothetical protein|nr:hypothetical protein [Bacteroidales bacterium]
MDFLKWYKNRMESDNPAPPEHVWENIQDQMDIDHSWEMIHHHLEQKAAARRTFWYAAAAGIMLFVLAGGAWWMINRSTQPGESMVENQLLTEQSPGEQPPAQQQDQQAVSVKERVSRTGETVSPPESGSDGKRIAEIKVVKQQPQVGNQELKAVEEEKILLAALEPYRVKIDDYFPRERDTLVVAGAYLAQGDPEKERVAFRKFYAGATGQLANTWLLNEKTYTGMESTSLTTSNASFGSNFGLFAGANLTRNLFIQLDLNLITQNNQDYNEYLDGQYISNEMQFNYSQLGFALSYIAHSNRLMQGEHHLYAGGYWGYLHRATQTIDREKEDITPYYSSSDLGVFLGYEYIFPITQNLGFGTGVKALYGLSNIYSGDQYIPSYLNKTHNASLNITFSLKYNLK